MLINCLQMRGYKQGNVCYSINSRITLLPKSVRIILPQKITVKGVLNMKKFLAILLASLFILGGASQMFAEGTPAEATDEPIAEQPTQAPDDSAVDPSKETEAPAEETEEPVEETEEPTEVPGEPAEETEEPENPEEPVNPGDPENSENPENPEEPQTNAPADGSQDEKDDYVTMKPGDWRVVMGADLTPEQRAQVYAAFGLKGEIDASKILTVTNAEERFYFEGKLPIDKIGHRSISCIYIKALKPGKGLKVETHNINYCTPEMYVNVLTTIGITDAKIIVAAPKMVSGTAALTGIYKAYESLTGNLINEYAKWAGIDELLATEELAEMIGSEEATEIINELKLILDQTQHMDDEQVRQKIREIADEYGVELTETEVQQILILSRTLEGLDVEQIRERARGLLNAANGWQKFTDGVVNVVEKIGDFFTSVGQFFKELFQKWFS